MSRAKGSRISLRTRIRHGNFALCVGLGVLIGSPSSIAGPWLMPGDPWLRSDIVLLADAGIIVSPVSSWPLSWGDIAQDVNSASVSDDYSAAENAALIRLQRRVSDELRVNESVFEVQASLAENPIQIRDFAGTPRADQEFGVRAEWTGLRFSVGVNAQLANDDANDDHELRWDNSYVAAAIGNWMVGASTLDRWWGPGWSGSLILSNNARPIPALTIERNFSKPFDNWFRWIGPWSTSVVWGQLERDRAVPNARFFGWRINFRPLQSLEIGLLRTAQWCGSGRQCDLDAFAKVLVGDSNLDEGVAVDVANQLAGVDFRLASPIGDWPYAVYGQFIGEDEASGLPSKFLGQIGAEIWGIWASRGLSWRAYAEFSDSTCQFYKSTPQFNCAYNNGNYPSGYRFRDRAVGFSGDGDTRSAAIGLIIHDLDTGSWTVTARNMRVNRGGAIDIGHTVSAVPMKIYDMDIRHERELGYWMIRVGVGAERRETELGDSSDLRAFVGVTLKL